MTTHNNGGPAFPSGIVRKSRPAHDPGADFHVTDFTEPRNAGMTLRDYFAGLAIGGLMAMIAAGKHDLSHLDGSTQEERLAVAGYRVADAMLKARETA